MSFDVGRSHRVRPLMNVTPLVDVVLVLLIIFMVVAPLLRRQFYAHLPQREAQAGSAADQVVVQLRADGRVWLNNKELAETALVTELPRIFATRKNGMLFFDADDAAPYGAAVRILDIARGAGAESLGILTAPLPR